jgi:hypothetical protein
MTRKQRREAPKKSRPISEIPTSFDKPIRTVRLGPADPTYQCVGDRGCGDTAVFATFVEKNGQEFVFPTCSEHTAPMGLMLDSLAPKREPRTDTTDYADIMPCPVCSDSGVYTHLLKIRTAGENRTVEGECFVVEAAATSA